MRKRLQSLLFCSLPEAVKPDLLILNGFEFLCNSTLNTVIPTKARFYVSHLGSTKHIHNRVQVGGVSVEKHKRGLLTDEDTVDVTL